MRNENMDASFMRFIAFPPVSYVPLSILYAYSAPNAGAQPRLEAGAQRTL
jgi:hypothetical protein